MPKYRSKIVEIEAKRYTGGAAGAAIASWAEEYETEIIDGIDEGEDGEVSYLEIPTKEGRMRASLGDWVIRGTEDEFYPCKDSVFQRKYEPMSKGEEAGTADTASPLAEASA